MLIFCLGGVVLLLIVILSAVIVSGNYSQREYIAEVQQRDAEAMQRLTTI